MRVALIHLSWPEIQRAQQVGGYTGGTIFHAKSVSEFRAIQQAAVAKLNECRHCTWGHHEWAHASGIPEEQLAHVENMDPEGFDRRKRLAVSYVRALVTENFVAVSSELSAELEADCTPHEIKGIELVARVMDLGNRGASRHSGTVTRNQSTLPRDGIEHV